MQCRRAVCRRRHRRDVLADTRRIGTVVQAAKDVAGNVPIISSCGYDTRVAIDIARDVKGGLAAIDRAPDPVRPPLTDLTDDEVARLREIIERNRYCESPAPPHTCCFTRWSSRSNRRSRPFARVIAAWSRSPATTI